MLRSLLFWPPFIENRYKRSLTMRNGRNILPEKLSTELSRKIKENIEDRRKEHVNLKFRKENGDELSNARVEIRQVSHDFHFGCIIFDLVRSGKYKPEVFKRYFREVFNLAVFPFYWRQYEENQGRPKWRDMIPALEWCKSNDIAAKGHPLLWTKRHGVPEWLLEYPEELRKELSKSRIINIVGGFSDYFDFWDVVNESIHVRLWSNLEADEWREEPISEVADYVEEAFRWAHKADSSAHLILNEFGVIDEEADEFGTGANRRFYELVKELKSRNVPLDGIGIQAHEPERYWYSPEDVWEALNQFEELGYPIHITEFIPVSDGSEIKGDYRDGNWTPETQAEYADQFYRICFGHPAVVSINWWGLSDRSIWREGGGLLDEKYETKPVYQNLRNLIKNEWMTRITTETDESGSLYFSGFLGEYEVNIRDNQGDLHSFEMSLGREAGNRRTFVVD